MKRGRGEDEIVSLNDNLITFDIEDINNIDELERRLELAIVTIAPVWQDCGTDCGTFCNGLSCGNNCGAKIGKILG